MFDGSGEAWRDVPGYEGLYQVNPSGYVKNLKTGKVYGGRRTVKLRRGNEVVNRSLHCLVLEAFHGPPPSPEHYAVRLDRNKGPELSNLAWRTRRELPPRAKLTRSDVSDIRDLSQRGVKIDEIASRYGITRQSVYGILAGRRWAT